MADATTDSRSDLGLSLVMTARIREIVPYLRRCGYAARLPVRAEASHGLSGSRMLLTAAIGVALARTQRRAEADGKRTA
jgi:hypothetical protein